MKSFLNATPLFAIFLFVFAEMNHAFAQIQTHTYKCEKGEFTLSRDRNSGDADLILNGKKYMLLHSTQGSIGHYFNPKTGYYIQLWNEPSISRTGDYFLGRCSYSNR